MADVLLADAPAISRFHLAFWFDGSTWRYAITGRNTTLTETRRVLGWHLLAAVAGPPDRLRDRSEVLELLTGAPGHPLERTVRFRVPHGRRHVTITAAPSTSRTRPL